MLRLASFTRWLLTILFTGIAIPVLADFFKKWGASSGAYDHPGDVWGWIVNSLSTIAQLPWVYPSAFTLGGLVAGVWLDSLLRKLDGSRANERRDLGNEFDNLADAVSNRQRDFRNAWPNNISDIHARIVSAFIRAKKCGIWTPGLDLFGRADGARFVVTYFKLIGTLLADGHFKEARDAATNAKAEFERSAR